DDTPKSHPRMGGSAHRAMFARSVDSGLRAFLGCHVGGGPAGKLEFRVPRQVASGHAVAILGEDLSVPGDEDRAEGFVARRECLARKFDGAAQVLQFNIIHHASSHARPAGGERGASDSPYHGGEGRGGRSTPAAKCVLTWACGNEPATEPADIRMAQKKCDWRSGLPCAGGGISSFHIIEWPPSP